MSFSIFNFQFSIIHRGRCLSILVASILFHCSCAEKSQKIDLSGTWEIALDSLDTGITDKWYDRSFSQEISLPGTLCDAGYGNPCTIQPEMEKEVFLNLKRKYDYVGVAWYRKTIHVPDGWDQKPLRLFFERIIWNSSVWIDGKQVEGLNESLTTPHIFDLPEGLSSGEHVFVLRVDNRKQHDISLKNLAHAYTNETQTMWNGVIGEMSLSAIEPVSIRSMVLTPDVDASKVHVQLQISDNSQTFAGKVLFHVKEKNGRSLVSKEIQITGRDVSFDYPIENPKLWDEFHPNLYEAVAVLKNGKSSDTKSEIFGMRKLTNNNAQLQINDRRIFLRGTLECCIFPLKGYPAMDRAGWEKVFRTAREYGLNHLRFHSWCPPEAAFKIADEMGFYLQVELPLWELNVGSDPNTTAFLFSEGEKMMQAYGNHPSFCFWSMGNELQGSFAVMDSLLLHLKQQDPRHLYMTTTFTFEKGHGSWPEPHDDFWVSQWTKKGWVRGQGVFDQQPVNFNKDYTASIDSLSVPIVTHEIGQYSVFPNLKEIEKYTGNLMPLNFLAVQKDLEKKGRLQQSEDYLMASGKLAALLYKEEIERALKTPGFSGFQLLDLHDFPGQGTALVGLLDAFWDSKGLIASETFRTFCAPVVPLVRFEKATYTNNETLHVKAELANFSDKVLKNIRPVWKLSDEKGQIIANGELPQQDVAIGNAMALGEFSTPLSSIRQAGKFTLSLSVKETEYRNSWDIWVYPADLSISAGEVVYTRDFNEASVALKQGKNVLLNPVKEDIKGLEGKFVQVFWSPVHFPDQPGTMGILCNPSHPALTGFPTEMHSNWQWWDLCKNARTMVFDSIPQVKDPIVRMVDNFYKNRNLGLLFEVKSEKGKLLVCSVDLDNEINNRPVAKQLLSCLFRYMQSVDFRPDSEIPFEQIEKALYQKIKK